MDRQKAFERRTTTFAKETIVILKKLPRDAINNRMIEQLVACAGSIGANYREATEAESKKDFIHKISISKKETKEAKHWIELLAFANKAYREEFRSLWRTAHEFLLIFSKIISTSKKNDIK